jgi:hypothetical protein
MFDTGIYQTDVIRETEKAILVRVDRNAQYADREVWLPKSQIDWHIVQPCFGPQLLVQPWLAAKHSL